MLKSKLSIIVFAFFIFSISVFLISYLITTGRTSFFGLASTQGSDSNVSSDNSYVFASPLEASTAGEQIRVTVFLLNSEGLGLANKSVTLETDSSVSINAVAPVTDSYGKAVFDISSSSPGEFKVIAKIGSVTLPQSVTVTFN